MNAIFLKILNLSYSASWLIIAVIIVRLLLKRAPKWVSCLLWALVALRLLIPFSLESAMSLLPSNEVVPSNIAVTNAPHIESGIQVLNSAVNPVIETTLAPAEENSVNPMQVVVSVLCIIWITGAAVMAVYAFISYARIRRSIKEAAIISKGVMESDDVKSPFILGIFRPVIYVPSGLDEGTLEMVLAHERAHIKRKDHLWKPLGFVLLSIYWFNPLSWAAYILLCRDIELACDEKVIGNKTDEYMAAYSQALLDCSIQRRRISACPVAFGETGVKTRIKNVLNYKKPAFWIVIAALLVCAVVAVCFLTSPIRSSADEPAIQNADVSGNDEVALAEIAGSFAEDRLYHYSGNFKRSLMDFTIFFASDGTYTWYEAFHSSFLGSGKYSIADGILTMTDDVQMTGIARVNRFRLQGDSLYYISEGSDNFNLITVEDGEEFYLGDIEDALFEPVTDYIDHGIVVWPTEKELVTALFSTDDERYHPETDIAGEIGDSVYAAVSGTIEETGFDDKDGNYIVESSGDIRIVYSHLEEILVSEKDTVTAGTVIATLGNTGRSTGPHLGVRLETDGVPTDFMSLFDTDDSSDDETDAADSGDVYRFYSEAGDVFILQDYSEMTSELVDGNTRIPLEIPMGAYGPKVEKTDADGDGEDEYIIAACEGTGTGVSQYGLYIVDRTDAGYRMTGYDSNYFVQMLKKHIGYDYDSSLGVFYVYEILPPTFNRWEGERVKPFPRHDELVEIDWSNIIEFVFSEGKVYLIAPTGYIYEDSPAPDYDRAVLVKVELYIDEDSGIGPRSYDFDMYE